MQGIIERYRDSRLLDAFWLFLLCGLTGFYCVSSASRLSATFDEPFYLTAGMDAWRTGSTNMLMRAGTMPLPVDVETGIIYAWERWRGEEFDLDDDFDRILPWARAGNLFFWFLLLIYSLKLGRYLAGPWAGRLAAGLVAFEPNLLAHASLATTDISITTATVIFVYYYMRTRESGWYPRVGLMGLVYGIMILTKASGMVFGPICMLVLEAYRLWPRFRAETPSLSYFRRIRWMWRATRAFRWESFQIGIIGMVLVFAWCGSDYSTQHSFVKWAEGLPDGNMRLVFTWLSTHLRIFPNAGEGIVFQIKHNFKGHGVFVMEEWYKRAVWYYFPLALLIKLSLPALILSAAMLLQPRESLRNPPFILALAFFAFSLNCRVQIGVRYMLPQIALLMIALAIAWIRSRPSHLPIPLRRGLVAAAFLVFALPSIFVWPHGLCYANPLWGGSEETYKYLSDSNFDWGQGLVELAEWQKEHPEAPLHVWYFGMGPTVKRPPHHLVQLHTLVLEEPEEVYRLLKGGYLAVSATLLYSNPNLTPSGAVALECLKKRTPIARTMTFFIYDMR